MPVARARWIALVLGLLAIVTPWTDTIQGRRPARAYEIHAETRIASIAAAFQDVPHDAVLLAGNSHAEYAGNAGPPPCGTWINAGIGGASARGYAAGLARIGSGAHLRLAVLLIGTNDIVRRDRPLTAMARAQFAADSASILAWLQNHAEQVVVAAVPPIGPQAADKRDPAAVAAYSEILHRLCRAPTCRFADPFARMRQDGGLARTGTLADAVHLTDYPAMLAALDACPSRSGR